MRTILKIIAGNLVVMAITGTLVAQTNIPQFTSIAVTDDQTIQLFWSSTSNNVYEVDEADSLINTNTGNIIWNTLYTDYPAQGTNTMWMDVGNYINTPIIPSPKFSSMRFYRVVNLGPDGLTNDEPTITVTSPTNGYVATGSLAISVLPYSDQVGEISTKLYVDGQEMWPSSDGTNYVINTCEWGNGQHIIFATVECSSGPEGYFGAPPALIGHGVSSYVPVIFSNLVTHIAFSQPNFQPSLGQTQVVSAIFAANSDWTLQIKDNFGNVVRNASGSGNSMAFNWDGLGDGETNIPPGVYYYYISAQTNGESSFAVSGGSSSVNNSVSSRDSKTKIMWAADSSNEDVLPLEIYPPGFDTNGLIIFSATAADIASLRQVKLQSSSNNSTATVNSKRNFPQNDVLAPSQDGPPSPQKPPTEPMAGSPGTVCVGYYNYAANGLAGFSPTRPKGSQGPNLGTINMENTTTNPIFYPIPSASAAADFAYEIFNKTAWMPTTFANDQLTISQLSSSGTNNPFNQYDLGILIMHCVYGSSVDYTVAAGCKQMYFPVTAGTGSQYLRMSDMDFGGSAPGVGLKWMALYACSSLKQANWQTMQNQNIKPYNSNLHMFLGADTEVELNRSLPQYWADFMAGNPTNFTNPKTIRVAWYSAASKAYHEIATHSVSPMRFATVYDINAENDFLQTQTNTVLSGSWDKDAVEVYPGNYP